MQFPEKLEIRLDQRNGVTYKFGIASVDRHENLRLRY